MKYQANPVIVDAFKIVSVKTRSLGGIKDFDGDIALDNGENVKADHNMMARYVPTEGDYWVIQSDGYIYLNPKDVFERKYSPIQNDKSKE